MVQVVQTVATPAANVGHLSFVLGLGAYSAVAMAAVFGILGFVFNLQDKRQEHRVTIARVRAGLGQLRQNVQAKAADIAQLPERTLGWISTYRDVMEPTRQKAQELASKAAAAAAA